MVQHIMRLRTTYCCRVPPSRCIQVTMCLALSPCCGLSCVSVFLLRGSSMIRYAISTVKFFAGRSRCPHYLCCAYDSTLSLFHTIYVRVLLPHFPSPSNHTYMYICILLSFVFVCSMGSACSPKYLHRTRFSSRARGRRWCSASLRRIWVQRL